MAVCGLTWKDSGMRAVDISQFPFRDIEVEHWFHYIEEEIQWGWGIHHDGILFILPDMLVVTSWKDAYKDLALRFDAPQYYMHVHPTWDIVGKNLFQPFEEKYGWKHFSLEPGARRHSGPADVFFKSGIMPSEPEKSKDAALIRLFGEDVREQGGILYADENIWYETNKELAFNGNSEPFRKYYSEGLIVC